MGQHLIQETGQNRESDSNEDDKMMVELGIDDP